MIANAACIGAGVIGAGWAARLTWNGIDVSVADPHPEAERRVRDTLANGHRALAELSPPPEGGTGRLKLAPSIAEAVQNADLVHESAPEDEATKRRVLAEIDAAAKPDALICSSTSGLLPSKLQADMARPQRFMVAHPFNPVYLLPLVEICGGGETSLRAIEQALEFFRSIGMKPLHLKKEIDGFVADRLMEALWREALWLVHDDVATVEEIDDAICYGPGIRWALMGSFLTYRMGGGEGGMAHFMEQFGPSLQWPWSKLTDVPELTDDFLGKIVAQSDAQAAGASAADLERRRDDGLVAVIKALKAGGIASGGVLAEYERRRSEGS